MASSFRFCPQCATPLGLITQAEDGGDKARLRCSACDYTHWNNPTPVLAAVIEYQGKVLLARGGVDADVDARLGLTPPGRARCLR